MRILFVTPYVPFPPYGDGTKLIIWNLAKELAQRHELSLICFGNSRDTVALRTLKDCFSQVTVVPDSYSAASRLVSAARSLASGRPHSVEKFRNKELRRQVADLVLTGNFDVVHVDTYVMAQYYREHTRVRWIIAPHDARSLTLEELHRCTPRSRIIKRLYLGREMELMRKYESTTYDRFASCVVVSERDRDYLLNLNQSIPAVVVRNGVRQNTVGWTPPMESQGIAFVGDMGYAPNAAAATWFVQSIFPHVRETVPAVRFYIVGRNPGPAILHLHSEEHGVIVTGEVDDVREYIRRCAVSVAPIKHGSGVKNKILDALALGRPVVAFAPACSGLAEGYQNVVRQVDSDEEMIHQVAGLLKSNNEVLGAKSMAFVRDHHSWASTASQYERLYRGEEK
jgi:glycosyltransferase involved in cell wall biosynthesis